MRAAAPTVASPRAAPRASHATARTGPDPQASKKRGGAAHPARAAPKEERPQRKKDQSAPAAASTHARTESSPAKAWQMTPEAPRATACSTMSRFVFGMSAILKSHST